MSTRKASAKISKPQTKLRAFTRITKSKPHNPDTKLIVKQEAALKELFSEKNQDIVEIPNRKRVRCDSEDSEQEEIAHSYIAKKTRRLSNHKLSVHDGYSLPSPPNSQDESNSHLQSSMKLSPNRVGPQTQDSLKCEPVSKLPKPLQEFLLLHDCFIRAFSIHAVHNGHNTPAELQSLVDSITCLYKKRAVTKKDIQHMLAIYEIHSNTTIPANRQLERSRSPFILVISGVGTNCRTTIEYNDSNKPSNQLSDSFRSLDLQNRYRDQIFTISSQMLHLGFIYGKIEEYPLLSCVTGGQTLIRKQKALAVRQEILKQSSQAQQRLEPDLATLSIGIDEPQAPQAIKTRTSSLFDRVKAKQLLTAPGSTATADALIRRRALGRIAEVVEIIRMKQQQKLDSGYASFAHSSSRANIAKVPFSLKQIVNEIRASLPIPLGNEEIEMCIKILDKEIPGNWLTIFEIGSIRSIVLNGPGIVGIEVKRLLES